MPTPGEGLSVAAFFGVSASAIGYGLTDAVINIFLIESLNVLQAPVFIRYTALALGGLFSVFLAPLAWIFGELGVRHRKYMTITLNSIGAAAAAMIASVMRDIDLTAGPVTVGVLAEVTRAEDPATAPLLAPAPPDANSTALGGPSIFQNPAESLSAPMPTPAPSVTLSAPDAPVVTLLSAEDANRTILVVVILAIVYRMTIQAAPMMAFTKDSARVVGEQESFRQRRDICLSVLYLNYRIGLFLGHLYVSSLPASRLGNLFPILETAAAISLFTCAVTVFVHPGKPRTPPARPPPLTADPPTLGELVLKAKADVRAVTQDGSKSLRYVYYETFWYGVAFGQVSAVTVSYYNEFIFTDAHWGDARGTSFAAYSAVISVVLGLVHDTLVPLVVFDKSRGEWGPRLVWTFEMAAGAMMMLALFYLQSAGAALVLLALLAFPRSAHSQFSFLGSGGLVSAPRLRPSAFAVRLTMLHLGQSLGAMAYAAVTFYTDFRHVMLLAAVGTGVAAFAAYHVGAFGKTEFSGCIVNANALFKYVWLGETPGSKGVVLGGPVNVGGQNADVQRAEAPAQEAEAMQEERFHGTVPTLEGFRSKYIPAAMHSETFGILDQRTFSSTRVEQ